MINRIIEFSLRQWTFVLVASLLLVWRRSLVRVASSDRCGAGYHERAGANQH